MGDEQQYTIYCTTGPLIGDDQDVSLKLAELLQLQGLQAACHTTAPEPEQPKPSRGTFEAPGWAKPDLGWSKR